MTTVAAICRAMRVRRSTAASFADSGAASASTVRRYGASLCVPLIVLAGVSACDRTSDKKAEAQSPSEAPPAPQAAAAAPEPKAAALPEKDVKALVERWLGAQNSGDFDSYEGLFAERFEGVKRVGNRRQSYDRKSWLTDRANMFKKDFTVKLDDLQIAASGASAIVQFVQTWTSATFKDEGPKRLLVVQGDQGLEIAKEEMLQSKLGGASSSSFHIEPRHFSFVWNDKIIFEELSDLTGVIGHPEPTQNNITTRPIDAKLLPDERKTLLGERFDLYGVEGKLCTVEVKALEVHVEVQPHFGQEQRWEGFDGATPVTPQGRALEVWELSAMGGRFLAGQLEIPQACDGAVWARSASLPPVKTWTSRLPTKEERAKILKEVRSQKEYQVEQRAYSGQTGEKTPWEETTGGMMNLMIFEGPDGAEYADASLFHTGGGCGADYEGTYWAMLRKKGDAWVGVNGPPESHTDSSWPRMLKTMRSRAAFDLDDDGIPEFAGEYDLIQSVEGKFQAVHNLSPGYFDCPC